MNVIICIWYVYLYGLLYNTMLCATSYKKNDYLERRNLKNSGEPDFKTKKVKPNDPIFVIQLHYASHKHFDVRLNIDGVLVSWAVPKGPSLDPSVKRLAIRTDDHPLDYAYFEGIIPAENYGAGIVMVWDIGTFEHITMHEGKPLSLKQALKGGKIEVILHGKKLEGTFVFIQCKGKPTEWLLKKINDAYAKKSTLKDVSALTNRTITQIKKDEST
jgi:bifunctional non-homologous end joining protein LigD